MPDATRDVEAAGSAKMRYACMPLPLAAAAAAPRRDYRRSV